MADFTNQLEVYKIEIFEEKKTDSKTRVKQVLNYTLNPIAQAKWVGKSIKDEANKKTLDAIHIISSEEDLRKYKNALGNEWIIRRSPNAAVQYYVKHPKASQKNVLIDANQFNEFVYDEYCKELINFCQTHCKAKSIDISRKESIQKGGKAEARVKDVSVEGKVDVQNKGDNIYHLDSPTGIKSVRELPDYIWLEPKLQSSIRGLDVGGSLHLQVIKDFSFGASLDFVKFIGGDIQYSRKFTFSIDIEAVDIEETELPQNSRWAENHRNDDSQNSRWSENDGESDSQ